MKITAKATDVNDIFVDVSVTEMFFRLLSNSTFRVPKYEIKLLN